MPWTRRIALAALALALAQAAWASISVAPLGLDLTLAAGQRAVGSFLVKNVSEEAQGVSVELVDYFQTVDGQNQFLAPGALARSLAPYVTYAPADFEVAPGQVQEVQFAVELPEEAGGPHWTMFMVRQRAPSASVEVGVEGQQGGFGFQASVSFGVQLRQVDPHEAVADGRVRGLSVGRDPEGRLVAKVAFENTGTTFLRPSGRVEVRDRTGQTVGSTPIEPFRVLPGATRELAVALPEGLAPGVYVALAILDFGAEFLVAGQAGFEL